MYIDTDILFTWGAIAKRYQKDEIIFSENENAKFYYQITEGNVKMFCANDEGREFIQGEFCIGSSFGDPPLIINSQYPATAIALNNCVILKLSKEKFLTILDEYTEINNSFMFDLALRVYKKSITNKYIINQKPIYRITSFLENYKKEQNTSHQERLLIPHTRQDIADFTGLRVETVIRTLAQMSKDDLVAIINHKLYY